MPAKNPGLAQFEKKLSELDELVRAMESGEIPLEQAVANFERGVSLSRECEKLLQQAELKVQQLIERDGQEQLEDFSAEPPA